MTSNKPLRRKYIIYDGRATSETDDAAVMMVCDSLKEAIKNAPNYGDGCCIWSYEVKGRELINERLEQIVWDVTVG